MCRCGCDDCDDPAERRRGQQGETVPGETDEPQGQTHQDDERDPQRHQGALPVLLLLLSPF